MASFMKASELLISKNNTVILDELKEKLSHIENAQLSEIYKEPSKSSTFKETYNRPCIETLQKFYQKIFKTNESFNIHEDHEFRSVHDTLHARMIKLEEINNGDYNGADPLTNEEMIQIFEHPDYTFRQNDKILIKFILIDVMYFDKPEKYNPDMSNNMPDGLLRRVFLWVGYCTA
ncbi:unnamed protein product [Rhizophagus irregularis]|nr:unnamed protein product [Rhizophagus irregularis]